MKAWTTAFGETTKMVKSTNQTIATDTLTKVEFETTEENTLQGVDLANNEFNIQRPGAYLITGGIRYSSMSATEFKILAQTQINGVAGPSIPMPSSGQGYDLGAFTPPVVIEADTADSITLHAFHGSGSDEQLSSSANTYLSVTKVGLRE